jgi:hypothetical protein
MINDTLRKLEQRLATSTNLSTENRLALEGLVRELKREIDTLREIHAEQAESIASFTDSSAREALRLEQDPEMLDVSLDGLQRSVRAMEASHPKLTSVVNAICHQLSTLGI